jgi:DNA-binding transcriptional LysR family regulator
MDSLPLLRKLQYVLAVVRDLHSRNAAEKLHVSQPVISRRIREYEEAVWFEIFHRDRHFVSLTKAGRAFVSDVEEILGRMDGDFTVAVRLSRAIKQRSSRQMRCRSFSVPPNADSPYWAGFAARRVSQSLHASSHPSNIRAPECD